MKYLLLLDYSYEGWDYHECGDFQEVMNKLSESGVSNYRIYKAELIKPEEIKL